MTEFTTKERKKEFDKIFREKILPFFENQGFTRHTKTSKRLFKEFENQLSVFIFFEHAGRFGSYSITVSYFDKEIGDVYDDNYLVMAKLTNNRFSGDNSESLHSAVNQWLLIQEQNLIPFIENHSTHRAILESDQFYGMDGLQADKLELLKRKSNL